MNLAWAEHVGSKVAVLSMDVEDWYYLDYFNRSACDARHSLLDGLDVFRSILRQHGIKTSFFVLGELAHALAPTLRSLGEDGHELASHGWNHVRPLTLSGRDFLDDLRRSKCTIEETVTRPVIGYRAPCFSLDRTRLDLVVEAGYAFDSSRMLFKPHALYGTIDLQGFTPVSANVFRKGDFFEFQLSTQRVAGQNLPVSGGGYIRILPWFLMKTWLRRYLAANELYVLYLHPFELSLRPLPPLPKGTPWPTRLRFSVGRKRVLTRLASLIHMLRGFGFEFCTFAELRRRLLSAPARA